MLKIFLKLKNDKLLEWKKLYSEKYAVLLEGARRVGKSTIAETFLQPQKKDIQISYIIKTFQNITCCFGKIN